MRSNRLKTKKQQHPISFIGKYEVLVLSDRRIILPTDVIRQLRSRNIKRLLPGRLPSLKALVLCPENLWDHWIKGLKKSFPCLRTHNGARAFIIPWQPVGWDTKGRITLPRRARDYAGIKAGDTVIIIGERYWFELWSEKEFVDMAERCEAVVRKSIQPLPSAENVIYSKEE